jgi:hypothetical protein
MDLTQAELAELAGIEQRLEELDTRKAELRDHIVEVAKAAMAAGRVDKKGQPILEVEPGVARIKVHIGTKKASADWKVVRAVLEEKNCTFVNGNGKIRALNEVLDDIVEKSRGKDEVPDNKISIKLNVPAA